MPGTRGRGRNGNKDYVIPPAGKNPFRLRPLFFLWNANYLLLQENSAFTYPPDI